MRNAATRKVLGKGREQAARPWTELGTQCMAF
jgi:hypothetical protein